MTTKLAACLRLLILLPSTNNLFNFLKRRYSHSQVCELNSVLKWRSRLIYTQERISHLKDCLDNSVLPKNIYLKVKLLRPPFVASVGRAFVKNEIAGEVERLERATRTYKNLYRKVTSFLAFFDWIRFSKLLGTAGCKLRRQSREDYGKKLKWLRSKRFGSTEANSAAVFNLSSVQLTTAQLEVLSCGPRFGIPPVSLTKEEILSEFEIFYKQIETELSDASLPGMERSARTRDFRCKLSGTASDCSNMKRQVLTFPFG